MPPLCYRGRVSGTTEYQGSTSVGASEAFSWEPPVKTGSALVVDERGASHQCAKVEVHSIVSRDFGMKAGREQTALPDEHGMTSVSGEHFDAWTHPRDDRRPDEHHPER